MTTPQKHRLIGQTIADRYRILELLGEGGMGSVYMAEHTTLRKQVALKVIHAEHAGNAELAARFAREAMATSRIDHPNVISALDFGQLGDGTAYLAVQLVRGPSLTRVLAAEGSLPWPRAAAIGAQIADALCAAHGHGIIHRDLKPDNVLLQLLDDGGEMVKVLDFGVAKFSSLNELPTSARKDVTQVGIIVGTPGYMAPEQALGSGANERSDLYALGVILWEAMAGRVLWSAPDLQRLVEKQLMTNPPRLRVVRRDAEIPPELDELVASLLARRVEDRPVDAAVVRDRLRELIKADTGSQRWSTGARPVPVRTPSLPPPRASEPKHPPRMVSSQPPARRPRTVVRLAWLVTALLAAIVAGVGVLVATGRLELRARGDMAAVAHTVAERFNLPIASEPTSKSGLPARLDASFARMIAAEELDERKAAANAILAHTPPDDVPSYARHMAYLQLAKTCHQKRLEVARLSDLGDPRALPLLLRLSARPKVGCGRKRREDCLACMRDELASAIARLEERRSTAAANVPSSD